MKWFSGAGLRLVVCLAACLLLSANAVLAQQQDSTLDEAVSAGRLTDPEISFQELSYSLIPLTLNELQPLTGAWLEIVKAKTAEVSDKQVALLNSASKVPDVAYQEIALLVEERAGLFERYTMVVDAFESKGGDTELIEELRAYRDSILLSETLLASPKAILAALMTWMTRVDGGLAVAKDIGILLLALIFLTLVARTARAFARRWFGRVSRMSKLLEAFLLGAVFWCVFSAGLLLVLAAIGVNVSPLFAMIGGASFVLAFAFQDTLGNLASGLMIMVNRPFDVGDYVTVGGVSGTIHSVSIVATNVTTPDNQVIIIPNKNVWGNVITNVTASETRRVDLTFGISYGDSIAGAQTLIEDVLAAHPLVLHDPKPVVRAHELASSSVNLICRPWAKTDDYWTVYWDLTHQVKEAFERDGISIPYPQRDLHIMTCSPEKSRVES